MRKPSKCDMPTKSAMDGSAWLLSNQQACRREGRRHGTQLVTGLFILAGALANPALADGPTESNQPTALAGNEINSKAEVPSSVDSEIIQRKPTKSPAGKRAAPTTPASGGWIRMLQPVVIVFGLMAVLTWAGRKWLPQARAASNAQSVIRVLARQHLSGKQSLCLVKLGPKVVLLGVTPEHIGSVLEIRDPDEAASLVAAVESSRGRSFTKAMAAFTASPEQDDEVEPVSSRTDAADANAQIREMVRRVRAMGTGSNVRTGGKLPVASRS